MGSSGGGGSASGAIDFPAYMKTWHELALGPVGTETITYTTGTGTPEDPFVEHEFVVAAADSINVSLTEAMNYAMDGNSPYAGFVTVDADDVMLEAGKAITDYTSPFARLVAFGALDFNTIYEGFKNTSILTNFTDNVEAKITALTTAESAMLDNEINTTTLPQFQGGMRDINAVMSSAFVIGESNIWAMKVRSLAKTDATVRWEALKLETDILMRLDDFAARTAINYMETKKQVLLIASDLAKMYAAMRVELDDFALENAAKDKLWDVKVFQYGGNFLGSIAGSAVSTDKGDNKPNRAAAIAGSAVGGAAAGAYIGSQIGSGYPGIGTAIGAVVGGLVGWLTS